MNKRIFATLFFSLFVVITGVGIVVPLLPVYAHSLGASGIYISLIFGSFSISRTLFLPYFGRASDMKGRKPFIITGLLSYAIISVAFIMSSDITSLIIIRFFQGIASAMIMPVVQAYVGDITPIGKEGFMMSLFNLSVFGSLSLGPVIGGIVNDYFDLQTTFAAMGIFSLISFFFALILLPPTHQEKSIDHQRMPVKWKVLLKSQTLFGLFAFRLTYTTCIGIIWSFLPVYADSMFHLSSSRIGILVMLGVFINGLLQIPMGYLADFVNRRFLVLCGGLILTYAVFSYHIATGFMDLFISSVLFGIGGGISNPSIMAMTVVKGHQTQSMGSIISILTMAHSLGMLIGSLVAGIIMDCFILPLAFSVGSGFMFLGLLLFIILTINKEQ